MFARALYRQEQYDASLLEAQQAFGQSRGTSALFPTAGLLATLRDNELTLYRIGVPH